MSKTIPPTYMFPKSSYVAVNPQLSDEEPVKVEKIKIGGSIISGFEVSYPFGNLNCKVSFSNE